MNKKLFIFDLDGTLVDAYPAIVASFNFTMSKLGIPEKSDRLIKKAVGWGDANLLKPFVPPGDLKKALKIYRNHHVRSLQERIKLMPYAADLLKCLKKKGMKMAIASNRPTRFTRIILKRLGIRSFFDKVLCADRLRFGKPHPLILNILVRELSIPKREVLYVGDMALDVRTGQSAGVETAAVSTGSSTRSELKRSRPAFLFKDLKALRQWCLKPDRDLA